MRPHPIELVFGEDKFKIRPLTIGQVRRINEVLADPIPEGVPTQTALISKNIEIIEIALHRDYPDVKVEELECSMTELGPFMQKIMVLGGMVAAEPGEQTGSR